MARYNKKEKCPCETDSQACCACVSMHCDECHKTFPGRSKFVQGRFCSNCGRPLKHDLERLYVPRAEVEKIFAEIEKLSYRFMNDEHYIFGDMVWDIAELKKKYLGDTI